MSDVIFIAFGVLLFIFFTYTCTRHKSPVKAAFLNMLSGVVLLAVSSVVLSYFGFYLAVNLYTVSVSLTLGAAGVALIAVKLFLI